MTKSRLLTTIKDSQRKYVVDYPRKEFDSVVRKLPSRLVPLSPSPLQSLDSRGKTNTKVAAPIIGKSVSSDLSKKNWKFLKLLSKLVINHSFTDAPRDLAIYF